VGLGVDRRGKKIRSPDGALTKGRLEEGFAEERKVTLLRRGKYEKGENGGPGSA